MNRKLKKSVVYVLYGFAFLFMIGGLFLIDNSSTESNLSTSNGDIDFVSKNIIDVINEIPVNALKNNKISINKPFNDESVTIVKNYYNSQDEEEIQENSIIYYGDTYIPSTGVSYGSNLEFDVVAILDGKVTEVKEDDILGNVITIEHDNGIVSVYQSVDDIKVKNGDIVNQGDFIAKSSTSNISADLGNHLYFELIINGGNVDPENYYGKYIDEI